MKEKLQEIIDALLAGCPAEHAANALREVVAGLEEAKQPKKEESPKGKKKS